MFKKINLYTRLFNERMEALLPEEALDDDRKVCVYNIRNIYILKKAL